MRKDMLRRASMSAHATCCCHISRNPASRGRDLLSKCSAPRGWSCCNYPIARSTSQFQERLKRFLYVQRPRDRDVIFDLATGKQLLFQ